MKKQLTLFVTAALLAFSIAINNVQAQPNPDHIVTINTAYMLPVDSAGRAELRGLLKEYFDKVVSRNEFIIHEWTMVHYYTDDSRELVTISEFANWADVDKANDRSTALEQAAWPDPKKRMEFDKKRASYISYHKDAIYHALPGMSK